MKNRYILKLLMLFLLAHTTIYGYTLSVKVDNLRNSKGVVLISLYNKDGSIPDQNYENFYKQKKVKIDNNKVVTIFENLKQGVYAVNILHDENNNGKIDKGLLLPTEGIGFTNFQTITILNKPDFKKASFLLDKNKTVDIKVIYF